MIQNLWQLVLDIWTLINEMSPYLLLGFLLAGLMHEFVPQTLYSRYLSGRNMRSVFLSALFGVPLPLCSCGVIPTAMGLHRQGASRGATVSFLIATPQTGVDSIVATYSLMGLPFAIVRPIVAMLTAVMGGLLINVFDDEDELVVARRSAVEPQEHHHAHEHNHEHGCGCGCGCAQAHTHEGLLHRLADALKYAFGEMMEDIGKWLVVGLLVAGIITSVVPDAWFEVFKDNSLYSILFVMLFSIPMYLCATGSIPIAVALMLKGLTPGAALVLLMAGPASNAASILVINKVLGRRTMFLYLASIVTGAVLFALGIDYLLPREWFTSSLVMADGCCHQADSPGWFSILCTVAMLLMLAHALLPFGHHHCHCNDGIDDDHCHCHDDNDVDDDCHCSDDECHCHDEHCECHHAPEATYTIQGMNCNHCAANAQRAIASIPGVESVTVDLHSRQAHVVGDCTRQQVAEAVESLGFSLT